MITEFCTQCGSKIEYSLKRPNFCSSCGTPLSEVAKASTNPTEETLEVVQAESSDQSFSSIGKLEYSIDNNQNKLTFGDLISQASSDEKDKYVKSQIRPKAQYTPGEDVIKSTMQQCRSNRKSEDINTGGQ